MQGLSKGIAAGMIAGVTLWPALVQEHPLTPALTYATWEANYSGFIDCGTPGLMARTELHSAKSGNHLPAYFRIPHRELTKIDGAKKR
jgi:hypothetical protein